MSKSVALRWTLDVQWSDAPEDVIEEVRGIWRFHHIPNDFGIYKFTSEEWAWNKDHPEFSEGDTISECTYPAVQAWLIKNGVPYGEDVWIHWWW